MDIGVNLPWGKYGYDFGVPFKGPEGPDNYNWRTFISPDNPDNLKLLNDLGINVIRMFILAGGEQLTPVPDPTGTLPGTPGPGTPSVSDNFVKDFEDLLERVHKMSPMLKKGLKLIPVFIDHTFAWEFWKDYGKYGRKDLLIKTEWRKPFLDNILQPLLDRSNHYPDSILAWEIINEPEFCTKDFAPHTYDETDPATHFPKTLRIDNVDLPLMRDFIKDAAGRIGAASFKATVGFQYFGTLKKIFSWKAIELGLTIYQFHYYGSSDYVFDKKEPEEHDPIPPASNLPSPCFVGEFPTSLGARKKAASWPRVIESASLTSSLIEIEKKGYPLVLPWSVNAGDERSDWEVAKEAIALYHKLKGD